jgi:hypothetical protein
MFECSGVDNRLHSAGEGMRGSAIAASLYDVHRAVVSYDLFDGLDLVDIDFQM